MDEQNLVIYRTDDGEATVALYARDGNVWLSQAQLAELFATSKQNISSHVINILEENELRDVSVVKDYFTTAADDKTYQVEDHLGDTQLVDPRLSPSNHLPTPTLRQADQAPRNRTPNFISPAKTPPESQISPADLRR
jgi:hypothetical protein